MIGQFFKRLFVMTTLATATAGLAACDISKVALKEKGLTPEVIEALQLECKDASNRKECLAQVITFGSLGNRWESAEAQPGLVAVAAGPAAAAPVGGDEGEGAGDGGAGEGGDGGAGDGGDGGAGDGGDGGAGAGGGGEGGGGAGGGDGGGAGGGGGGEGGAGGAGGAGGSGGGSGGCGC